MPDQQSRPAPPELGVGGPSGTTILDTILARKHEEVAERRSRAPLETLEERIGTLPVPRDFIAALRHPRSGRIGLIAEVKKASPSAGVIRPDFDPLRIARAYAESGADCLSVLTDEQFFQGRDTYLTAIREAIALPLLRKDFLIDPYQVYESRALGADAVLLIVAALHVSEIHEYARLASRLGMAALIEVHTEAEMETALSINAKLIGINSRDLHTFQTDLTCVARLAAMAPRDVTLVAESGIKTPADVAYVQNAGARALLVGETLMRAPDISTAVRKLLGIT